MVRISPTLLRFSFLVVLALAMFLLGARPVPVHAAPFLVTRFDDPAPSGCVAGDCSLREAIIAANGAGGPLITLPAGTYTLSRVSTGEDAAADGDLDITDNVTITGAGAGSTIIDGNGNVTGDRVFEVDPASAGGIVLQMSGVTVQKGHEAMGGGILNYGSLILTDSIVAGNVSDGVGGGLFNEQGAGMALNNVTVTGNSTYAWGGGIWSDGGLLISDSTISGNSSSGDSMTGGNGGGIYNQSHGILIVSGSTVIGNTATGAGPVAGGIYNAGLMVVVDSSVIGNSAPSGSGGGIGNEFGVATVSNSTITGNAASSGGGVDNRAGISLYNDTITANSASTGGGIWAFDATLISTIVAGNLSGGDCFVTVGTTSSHSLDGDNSCDLTDPSDLSATGPNLGPLADNGGPTLTYALLPGSPAIDAGNNAACPAADQRGFPRPRGAACDIGAVEYDFDSAMASGDFNGDGKEDLAVGSPGEDIGAIADAGAVSVLYGSGSGLTASANQLWYQGLPGVIGQAEANDLFGETLVSGDFNGDGFDDLAVGAPGEDIGAIADAGAVNVLYGSPSGLTDVGDQLWHQSLTAVIGEAEAGDRFGDALVSGDFDGDGKDDLAVGTPDEDVGTIANAGAVNVIYGSGSGLTASGDQIWHQALPGVTGEAEAGDRFGAALATSDFDVDSKDDLAVGAPGEDVGTIADAGAVNVLYGSGSGLATSGNQIWHQSLPGVIGQAEINDRFGTALVGGDFDGDGKGDLAVGTPEEDVGAIADAGAVNVLYGSGSGLTASGDQLWYQGMPGVIGQAEAGDRFGGTLASGDFDGDGRDDLTVGAPGEDVGAIADAGAVNLLYGSGSGLTASGDQIWHQALTGVIGQAEAGDLFGDTLVSGDFDDDGKDDLAVGAPGENIGAIADAGAANVLYGSGSGLSASGDQIWYQGLPGVIGQAEAGDRFAFSLEDGDETAPGARGIPAAV